MNAQPYRDCPRFDRCSVNACPLAPVEYPTHPDDKEKVCPMEKGVRVRIAAKYPGVLPREGLTSREWAARQAYDRLPAAVKSQMAERGRMTFQRLRRPKDGQ